MVNAKAVALSSKFDVIMSLLRIMGLEKIDDDNIDLVRQVSISKELQTALVAACKSAIVSLEIMCECCSK